MASTERWQTRRLLHAAQQDDTRPIPVLMHAVPPETLLPQSFSGQAFPLQSGAGRPYPGQTLPHVPDVAETGPAPRRGPAGPLVQVGLVAVCTGLTGLLVGRAAESVAGDRMAPWILGRASGICAYLLLVTLVVTGLLLSHPARARWQRPGPAVRIRAHVSLAVFTAVFIALHVAVLATDRYAHVGWWGALLPMASVYRPVAVTMGVVATYSGIAAGVTAAFAGRWAARVWWPVHKVAVGSLVLTLLHAVLSGADTGTLTPMYVVTAGTVAVLAVSRYRAAATTRRTQVDRSREA